MSIKIGKGVPPAAKLEDIVKDLFQNEKTTNLDLTKTLYTFSAVNLTPAQKLSIVYPLGFNSLDYYIITQTDTYGVDKNLISTRLTLVSFAKKDNKFIYGFYYNVIGQDYIPIKHLTESRKPIDLSPAATLVTVNYMEVYNDVNGITTILGLSGVTNIYASLQFSNKGKYYYESLSAAGIDAPNLPETELTCLSRNLEHNKC